MRVIAKAPSGLPVYLLQVAETAYEIHPPKKKRKNDPQLWELLRIKASGDLTMPIETRATPNECRDVAVEHGGRLKEPMTADEKQAREKRKKKARKKS